MLRQRKMSKNAFLCCVSLKMLDLKSKLMNEFFKKKYSLELIYINKGRNIGFFRTCIKLINLSKFVNRSSFLAELTRPSLNTKMDGLACVWQFAGACNKLDKLSQNSFILDLTRSHPNYKKTNVTKT